MMNPAAMIKLMNAKKRFEEVHPKFAAFFGRVFSQPIPEGTVIEISVTYPGQEPVVGNMKVQESDLELFEEIKTLTK